MLADEPPDIKPSVKTDWSEPAEPQAALPPSRTDTRVPTNEHRGGNSQVQVEVSNDLAGLTNQRQAGEPVANFGWEQIDHGPLLPFITRGSERYVACPVIVEKVFKNISSVFSPEMIRCAPMPVISMTQSEAKTFNEINTEHCDGRLVGTYVLTERDCMVNMNSVKEFITFFHACRNLVICGAKNNYLFGFIRIGGHNEVPFVWCGNQRLVPLFYFEGIETEVIPVDLVDPWKIAYLKFCFKMQKVRQELCNDVPLKVTDFRNVEGVIPAGTTFELCLPKNFNQAILAPELRTVNHVASTGRKRSTEAPTVVSTKQTRSDVTDALPSNSRTIYCEQLGYTARSQPNLVQTANQLEKTQLDASQLMLRGTDDLTITPVYRQKSNMQQPDRGCAEYPDLATITSLPPLKSQQQPDYNVLTQPQQLRARNPVPTKQNEGLKRVRARFQGSGKHVYSQKLQQLATGSNVSTSVQTTKNLQKTYSTTPHHTNISPRHSPTVSLPHTMVAGQRHPHSNNLISTALPSESGDQNKVSKVHEGQSVTNHQMSDGNSLGTPSVTTQGSADLQHQQNRMAHTVRNNSAKASNNAPISQKSPGSLKIARVPVDSLVNIALSNSSSLDHPSVSTGVYHHNQHGAYGGLTNALAINIQQLAAEKAMLDKNGTLNRQELQMLQKDMQQKTQKNSSYANSFSSSCTDYKAIYRSEPPTYHQHHANATIPVVQNINVAVTNVVVSENNLQNYLSEPGPSVTTNATSTKDKTHTVSIKFLIPEHIVNIDTFQETYTIKHCFLGNKKLVGIRISLVSHEFLINCKEFAEKFLTRKWNQIWYAVISNFKTLYKLNPVQKDQWNKLVPKARQLKFSRQYEDVFVAFNDVISVLKRYGVAT